MLKLSSGVKKWENRHQTFTEKVKVLYIVANEKNLGPFESYLDTTKGLQGLISEAIQAGKPLRSLGAGWSWTKIATAKDGIMMDTKQLNISIDFKKDYAVAGYPGDVKNLLFAQCGCGVWELSNRLRDKKLSLKTSGASNGQTIVGAMSTGAHGSTFDVGAMQEYILGMHLITGPNRHIWLERKTQPVVSTSFIQLLQTELVQDDDLFNAALVSFGSFGIIHGVLVEAEDLFLIETNLAKMPYDDTLKKLMATLDFSKAKLPGGNERPFHFSVSINPYDIGNGVYVSTYYKRPFRSNYTKPVPNDSGVGPGDDAPCFLGRLTDKIPRLTPKIVKTLVEGALKPFEKQYGTLGEIFSNTTFEGKLMSAAIGLPLDQVGRVTELLLKINETKDKGPFTGLFAYRFIKKSTATLAFTHFDGYTCILELDGVFSKRTDNFYKAVWEMLDQENIPYTAHWGKMNGMNKDRIRKCYGKDVDSWVAARNKLLDKDCLKAFTNPLLEEWGLDKVI